MNPDWISFINIRSFMPNFPLSETTSHLLLAYVMVISTSDSLQSILFCNDNDNLYVGKKRKIYYQTTKAALLLKLFKASHLSNQN